MEKSCRKFLEETASRQPVPGGGSVSAYAGALGAALGNMVGSLTLGKARYADVEKDMIKMMRRSRSLQGKLLRLSESDTRVFKNLMECYRIKAETDEEKEDRARKLEEALREACEVPLSIMEACGSAIELAGEFAEKGSTSALSDAGASAAISRGALQAASLNVYINTRSMKDRALADRLEERCAVYLMKYTTLADEIFDDVMKRLREK